MAGATTSLRPIDLARAAGISTQQVRNYADAGLLPSAPRTASGYRTFTGRHRQALLTYRALAGGYGPPTAQAIMLAVHADDVPHALALLDASHAALHEQCRSVRAVGDALEAVAQQDPDTSALPRSRMRIGDVSSYLRVRTSALRVWDSAGLLAPRREPGTKYRQFSPADIRDAQMIHMLRQAHYSLPAIAPVLDGLRRTGSSDALRTAIAGRQAGLTSRATAMLEGSSHLHHYVTDN